MIEHPRIKGQGIKTGRGEQSIKQRNHTNHRQNPQVFKITCGHKFPQAQRNQKDEIGNGAKDHQRGRQAFAKANHDPAKNPRKCKAH